MVDHRCVGFLLLGELLSVEPCFGLAGQFLSCDFRGLTPSAQVEAVPTRRIDDAAGDEEGANVGGGHIGKTRARQASSSLIQ